MVETRGSRRRSRSDLSLETNPPKESSQRVNKPDASPKQVVTVAEKEPKQGKTKTEKTKQDESVKVGKTDAAKAQEQSAQSSSSSSIEQTNKATHVHPKKKKKPQKKAKATSQKKNELTHILPGYTAPMKLLSSSLDGQRGTASVARASGGFQLVTKPTKLAAPSYAQNNNTAQVASFKTGKRPPPPFKDAGAGWFHMRATSMTEQVAEDLKLIRNRNYLDPKRFYKSTDTFHNTVQVGTVIEGASEYYSSRLTKKQRKETLVQEVLADSAVASYAQDKYRKMQQEKTAASLKRRKQQFKRKGNNKYGRNGRR